MEDNIVGKVGKKPIKISPNNSSGKTPNKVEKLNIEKGENETKKNNKNIFIIIGIIVGIILLSIILNVFSKPSIEKIKDSVVMLEVYNDDNELIATGSGFCAYKSDYIVTNFHVIEGAYKIKIITDDNESYSVNKILIFDPTNDLALLSANVELEPIEFGSVSDLKAGEKVTVIGSPLGELNTVSEGIISNATNKRGIQISAAISHGSSGGVLLNDKNKLIGITYATLSNGQNLNYAISIDYLKEMYSAYKDKDFYTIKGSYIESCMNSDDIISFEGCIGSYDDYYSVDSFKTLYEATDHQSRYDYAMSNNYWDDVYDDVVESDRELMLSYYETLLETEFDKNPSNISTAIKNWNVNDFMINLGVLQEHELAFVLVDLDNFSSDNAKFDRVEEYDLSAAQKTLILYLIGDRDWNIIHKDNKGDVFDYFDEKGYSTRDLGAILETLGYDVVYENDGTLTAYWR